MKISYDLNGNKILKISGKDLGMEVRGFSIITSDNLPYTHRNDLQCTDTTKAEVFEYIKLYGTDRQKLMLQTEEEFTLQNIRSQRLNYRPYWRQLSEKDLDSLVDLLGSRCRHETKRDIRSGLQSLKHLESSWVFGRVMYCRRWTYCEGQDHTAEMPLVRKVFTK